MNPGTPQQQNLATSMANLEEQFKTELQVAKAQKQAPKDPKHLSNKQSLGSEPDDKTLTTYKAQCDQYFSQNTKLGYTANEHPPSKDNDYKIGTIKDSKQQEEVAIIKYGSIEGKKTDTISDMTEDHYEAFITFLKMESSGREPPVTITINNFSPTELTGFLNKLQQDSDLTKIVLELSDSAAKCIYGANKHYTDDEYATAQQLVEQYNKRTPPQEQPNNPTNSPKHK